MKPRVFLNDLRQRILIPVVCVSLSTVGTHCSLVTFHRSFAMEAFDLEFVKLDEELANEVLKDIVILVEKFGRLLICEYFLNV